MPNVRAGAIPRAGKVEKPRFFIFRHFFTLLTPVLAVFIQKVGQLFKKVG